MLYFIPRHSPHGYAGDNVATEVAVGVVISNFCKIYNSEGTLALYQYIVQTNSLLSINVPQYDLILSHGADADRNGNTGYT